MSHNSNGDDLGQEAQSPMPRDAWSILKTKDKILSKTLDGIAMACNPDVIADIGCFNGDEIARFRSICPSSKCYAFEANVRNIHNYIWPRTDLSGVTIENLAIAEYDGEIEFNVLEAEGEQEDWRRAAGSLSERTDGISGNKVRINCSRLDTYFARELEQGATFLLWIDVEGALDRVLAGAPKVLSRTIALRAEVERHSFWAGQKLADDMHKAFTAAGFSLLADSYTSDAFAQSDVIYVNRDWLKLAARDK